MRLKRHIGARLWSAWYNMLRNLTCNNYYKQESTLIRFVFEKDFLVVTWNTDKKWVGLEEGTKGLLKRSQKWLELELVALETEQRKETQELLGSRTEKIIREMLKWLPYSWLGKLSGLWNSDYTYTDRSVLKAHIEEWKKMWVEKHVGTQESKMGKEPSYKTKYT